MEREWPWHEPNMDPEESQAAQPGGDLTNHTSFCLTDQETNHQIIRQQPRGFCSPPENKAGTQIIL